MSTGIWLLLTFACVKGQLKGFHADFMGLSGRAAIF